MICQSTANELHWLLRQLRTSQIRTMREFAEQEIVLPDGPYKGRKFRCDRQPYTGHWFDAIDSESFTRFVATGPTQSGKTLACFLIPLLYHLFEIGETVICGLPDMDMAADKWREDILPMIEHSRYRELMPSTGSGSRGGQVDAIQFLNGATLKFMSGGGGDKSRAGFTSRVVVITETDGMDRPGASSRESDKVTQLEARTRAFGQRKRIYLECTVSTQDGRTWQEYQHGSCSQLLLPCPHCEQWTAPEREHLIGWQEAPSQMAARQLGRFSCPQCGALWSEEERRGANHQARLRHAGQQLNALGEVVGDPRLTETLGFRWSAVHNLFLSAGDLAADEWRTARTVDEELAEREMRQFVWCLPIAPSRHDETYLQAEQLMHRTGEWAQGLVPADTQYLTAAIDLGKYLCHWVAVAWRPNATGHVIDYGRIEVPSPELGVEQGLTTALREFADLVHAGWKWSVPPAGKPPQRLPDMVWIDAGYMTEVVYAFCRNRPKIMPAVGRGVSQQKHQWYQRPKSTGAIVKQIGEGYHIAALQSPYISLVEVDADHWKSWVHQRLATPQQSAGAMTLFQATPQTHLALAKHLTAEKKTEEFLVGKGVVTRWDRVHRNNHWLDALYNACAAGHYVGARLLEPERKPVVTVPPPPRNAESDQSFIDVDRWDQMMRRWN